MTPNMISMFYTDVAHLFCLFVTNERVASCFTGGKSVGDEPGSMVLGLPLLSSPARWKTRSSRWIWQEKRRLNCRVSSNVSKIPQVRAFPDVLSKERCKGKNGVSFFVFYQYFAWTGKCMPPLYICITTKAHGMKSEYIFQVGSPVTATTLYSKIWTESSNPQPIPLWIFRQNDDIMRKTTFCAFDLSWIFHVYFGFYCYFSLSVTERTEILFDFVTSLYIPYSFVPMVL